MNEVVARVMAIALLLEGLWLGVSASLVFALELFAFDEDRGQGVDGRLLGLGGLTIALLLAIAGIRLLAVGRDPLAAARPAPWLGIAGLANLVLAVFWAVVGWSSQGEDPMPGAAFVVITITVAVLCLGLAWRTGRPPG